MIWEACRRQGQSKAGEVSWTDFDLDGFQGTPVGKGRIPLVIATGANKSCISLHLLSTQARVTLTIGVHQQVGVLTIHGPQSFPSLNSPWL